MVVPVKCIIIIIIVIIVIIIIIIIISASATGMLWGAGSIPRVLFVVDRMFSGLCDKTCARSQSLLGSSVLLLTRGRRRAGT
jgi:hypothetical protein